MKKDKQEKRKKKADNFDTETTFANMNIEGFSWYDPHRKSRKKQKSDVTKKEYRAMVRGAFRAMWPIFVCLIAGALLMGLLTYLWLN